MVYNYTIPRGPVAAMYSSPGPCYGLPGLVGQPHHDPRSVHNKGPAYPFGVRHGKWRDDAGPGPCYLPTTYRDGPSGAPMYSIYGRPKYGSAYTTPGPGAYKPEDASKRIYSKAPEHVIAGRQNVRSKDGGPGPNAYMTDPMLGRTLRSEKSSAPCYTITGRSQRGGFHEDLQRTPGPGTYGEVAPRKYKRSEPCYSMTGRNQMPSDSTRKPGPGAYNPTPCYPHVMRSSQGCTFGIRHSQYKGEALDNTYDD